MTLPSSVTAAISARSCHSGATASDPVQATSAPSTPPSVSASRTAVSNTVSTMPKRVRATV